jgi:hypothetical protein
MHRADAPEQFELSFTEALSNRRSAVLERTVDSIADKFGTGALVRAGSIGQSATVVDTTPNLDFVDDQSD